MTPNTPHTSPDRLRLLFDEQYLASRAQGEVPLALRRDRLLRIRALLDEHGSALAQSVQSKWARGDSFYPPYDKRFDQVMGLLKRMI